MITQTVEYNDPPQLDAVTIDELLSLDEDAPGTAGEIIAIYYIEAQKRLDALDRAAASYDFGTAATAAHALRGCSANVGAIHVAQNCALLEEAARSGRQIDLALAVETIHSAYDAVLPWLARVVSPVMVS